VVNAAIKTKRFSLAQEYLVFIRKSGLFATNFTDLLEAKVQIGLNNPGAALRLLEKATENYPESPDVLIDLGRILNTLRESERAKTAFGKAIEMDPDNAYAHHGYGVAAMSLEDYETALEYFLNSVDRFYHYPMAHLHLGETLALMKEYEMAKRSFEVVIAIYPTLLKAYRWLYDLAELTENAAELEKYKGLIQQFHKGEKTIITGLPGAKLAEVMNQIETKGKSIHGKDDLLGEEYPQGNEWFDGVKDDLLYVPIGMLGSIPERFSYRILFVNDSKDDIAMFLNERGRLRKTTYNETLLSALNKQEGVARVWMGQQPHLDILYVNSIEDVKTDLTQTFIS
jgi:tetratricopeptide (TPR) repeat protein